MESSDTMGYFPFFIDIKGKKCIIVGGGNIHCITQQIPQ